MNAVPDEILCTVFLPKLPLNEMKTLCNTCQRFDEVRQDDRLWQQRTFNDYLSTVDQRPSNVSWREHYKIQLCGRYISIYYHGDRICDMRFLNYLQLDYMTHLIAKQTRNDVVGLILSEHDVDGIFYEFIEFPSYQVKTKTDRDPFKINRTINVVLATDKLPYKRIFSRESTQRYINCSLYECVRREFLSPFSRMPVYIYNSGNCFIIDRRGATHDDPIVGKLLTEYTLEELRELVRCFIPKFHNSTDRNYMGKLLHSYLTRVY